jgi:hypothetical protein
MEGKRIGSRPFSSNITSIDRRVELCSFPVFAIHYRDSETKRPRAQENLEKAITKDDETRTEIGYLPEGGFGQ